jgi:hypothetical protein
MVNAARILGDEVGSTAPVFPGDSGDPRAGRRGAVNRQKGCVQVVDGWCSVEELTRYGFTRTSVVMVNEAHDGMTRCIRTREVGARMIRAAHASGVRRLAMEALPRSPMQPLGPFTEVPAAEGGYLSQPDMQRLIATALELGWSLWAYEAIADPGQDRTQLRSLEFTNWREREQARNLCEVVAALPGEPLLVWCGNSHAAKAAAGEWIPMGQHFAAASGVDSFVIDQTVTVDFPMGNRSWVHQLLASIAGTLAEHGGTAGILRDQAPEPLKRWTGVDALVVSADNAMT